MTRRNASARIEQISIQAFGCKRVRVVMRQLGTVLNRLQGITRCDVSYCEPSGGQLAYDNPYVAMV